MPIDALDKDVCVSALQGCWIECLTGMMIEVFASNAEMSGKRYFISAVR